MTQSYKQWHQRLDHINTIKFLELKNKQLVDDLELINLVLPSDNIGEDCIKSKQIKLLFNKCKTKSFVESSLFIIHFDLCNLITPILVKNKNYFVTFNQKTQPLF